ncbi:hypothetical protein [Paenibacillus sp. UNC496MF]|uniref:hypothetical protein n=1 Tax=Paenibacillus sp. UNC496MF TaxID=1502753 RepID=UPI001C433D0E|nr:hypothetical protein [Paenibacillus sp. UNC496MF]
MEALIKKSRNGEAEVSTSHLAEHFGVKGPSMEYHLKNLVEEGSLLLSDRRGAYNRKIYKLPGGRAMNVQTPLSGDALKEQLIKIKDQALGIGSAAKTSEQEKPSSDLPPVRRLHVVTPLHPEKQGEQPAAQEQIWDEEQEKRLQKAREQLDKEDREKEQLLRDLERREKTLEEKIDDFTERTRAVPQPQEMLTKDDREILAVMNESIQQNILYMKDLAQQLSTVETKAMVQHLIEDRNQNLEKIAKMEQELKDTYRRLNEAQQAQSNKESNAPDPGRIRMMQQLIAATVDQFVDSPNHTMALNKGEFRKNLNKDITSLIQYVLGIQN